MQMLVEPKAIADANVARKSNHVASRHASVVQVPRYGGRVISGQHHGPDN